MDKIEPFEMDTFSCDGMTLKATTPIKFNPEYDEDCEAFVVSFDDLDLFSFGINKNSLIQDIMENLVYDWQSLVLCEEDELDASAIAIRNKLKSMLIQL